MKILNILFFLFCVYNLKILADLYDEQFKDFSTKKPLTLFSSDGKIKVTKDFSSNTACNVENWDNVAQYACRCCIVSKADAITEDVVNGTGLLDACKKNGLCSDKLITALKNTEGLTNTSDTDFVNMLYDRSVVIKEVSVGSDSKLKSTGKFTEDSIKNFLVHAFKSGKMINNAFSHANDLSVTNLGTGGGTATAQLFLVKNTKTNEDFIVKEVAKAKAESFDLSLASHYKPLEKFTAPQTTENAPTLLLPLAYLKYYDNKGSHYLIVMPKSPGIEFLKLMKEYVAAPSDTNKKRLADAYRLLGVTLANFHKTFMKNAQGQPDSSSLLGNTLVHGDFHAKNIFYDEKNQRIYWIDLERLGKSVMRPTHIGTDLVYTIAFPFLADWLLAKANVNAEQWAADFYTPFINAYLATFGGDKKIHAQEMKKLIRDFAKKSGSEKGDILSYIDKILDTITLQSSPNAGPVTWRRFVVTTDPAAHFPSGSPGGTTLYGAGPKCGNQSNETISKCTEDGIY